MKPDDSLMPMFKAVPYSMSWVRDPVTACSGLRLFGGVIGECLAEHSTRPVFG